MGFVEKMQDRPQRALDLAFDKYPLGNFINAYEYLKYTGEIGGRTALDKLGISLNFAIKDKKLIAMLKDSENFLLSSVDKTTKEWIAAKIAEEFDKFGFAKDEAKTFRKIAEDINQMFKEISVSRAELIISNEAANAAAIVEEKTFKENGARYWTWATNNDGRVTAGCLENQAAGRRRIGDAFPSGHTRNPRFPGCRCWMEPDLDTLFPVSYVYTG